MGYGAILKNEIVVDTDKLISGTLKYDIQGFLIKFSLETIENKFVHVNKEDFNSLDFNSRDSLPSAGYYLESEFFKYLEESITIQQLNIYCLSTKKLRSIELKENEMINVFRLSIKSPFSFFYKVETINFIYIKNVDLVDSDGFIIIPSGASTTIQDVNFDTNDKGKQFYLSRKVLIDNFPSEKKSTVSYQLTLIGIYIKMINEDIFSSFITGQNNYPAYVDLQNFYWISNPDTFVNPTVKFLEEYTHYLGGFQYKNNELQFFPTAEGYVNVTDGGKFNYVYNYTDHLGNVRVSYSYDDRDNELKILEENHYYPFGLKHSYNTDKYGFKHDDNNNIFVVLEPVDRNKYQYKYNGKEFQDELSLNWYDYQARNYDPAIGRWISVDPLAEKYPGISPYAYCANNPIYYIDPDGREIVIPTSLKGSERRQIMRNLGKLTNDKLSYDKSTGQVTIGKQRTGSKAKGTELISRVINSSNTMTITVGAKGSGNSESDVNSANAINGVGSDVNVSFDPTSNPDILTVDPKTGNVSGKKRPNQIGLGHEIIHGERSMRGEAIDYSDMGTHTYQDENGTTVTQTVPKEELGTVGLKHNTSKDITENDLRKEQGKTKNKQRGAY